MSKAGTDVVNVVEGPPTTMPYDAGPAGETDPYAGGAPDRPVDGDTAEDAGTRPVNVEL